jgi:hypothetical protein
MQKKTSYDDVVRASVPLPDSSRRPSRAEVRDAVTRSPGPRFTAAWPDPDDDTPPPSVLLAALDVLHGADLSDLTVALDHGRLTLEGSVATQDDRERIVRALGCVDGVATVIDTLRVRT